MFLLQFPITCVMWTVQELHGCDHGASNMVTRRSSLQNAKGKIVLNKEPNSSFSVGHRRRYKVDLKHLVVA